MCVAALAHVSYRTCMCVFVCVCARVRDPAWLVSNKEMKPIVGCFFPLPQRTIFFYYSTCTSLSHWVCSHAETLRQASAASILWTEVLSGYYFWVDHIKTTAIKRYWPIRLCLLRGKKGEWVGRRRKAEKTVCVKGRKRETSMMLPNGQKDFYVIFKLRWSN